ncbi:MAG: metal/formaldehyde-sensitive transcriptional repressor [Rhodospirillales bacterium]|nr:metal/formaldehyde-sensitive transcriptional repressor [Rhodospirillales bacterium]
MSHITSQKKPLLARVRRIRGQMEAIERALEDDAGCGEMLHLIAGARGAIAGLMAEVVEGHVRAHLMPAPAEAGTEPDAVEQLLAVVRTYLR